MNKDFLSYLDGVRKAVSHNWQRTVIWISGTIHETYDLIDVTLNQIGRTQDVIWVSREFSQLDQALLQRLQGCEIIAHGSHLLGTQSENLIFDAHPGFDPDLFCCAVGTLKASGILFLLTESPNSWPINKDKGYESLLTYPHTIDAVPGRFIERFCRALTGSSVVAHWNCATGSWQQELDNQLPHSGYLIAPSTSQQPYQYTQDQQSVVAKVKQVAFGHRNRPLVLTADRGRGKSAALGYAIATLAKEKPSHQSNTQDLQFQVLISAPYKDNVQVLLQHCDINAESRGGHGLLVKFYPPDELLRLDLQPDLVVVDEAAAIPEYILAAYLDKFSRVVFSTTTQGYEGTGRGFSLRFKPLLARRCPDYSAIHLNQPIRWGERDVLEATINEAFLLKDQQPQRTDWLLDGLDLKALCLTELSQDYLSANEGELAALFGLLVQAHYRTRPSDLRALLDTLNFRVWVLKHDGCLLGCCWVAMEGGMDRDITQQIYLGKRRPRGHLLPQVICQTLGNTELTHLSFARVVRIAITPELQSRGLGSYLLQQVEQQLSKEGVDILGSSFSAFHNVVGFWSQNGYKPIHMGYSREASSGAHGLLVTKSGKPEIASVLESLERQFINEFLYLLNNQFRHLDSRLIVALLSMMDDSLIEPKLAKNDYEELRIFAVGGRTLEASLYRLNSGFIECCLQNKLDSLEGSELDFLIEMLLKNLSIDQLREKKLVSGRKNAINRLRAFAKRVIGFELPDANEH